MILNRQSALICRAVICLHTSTYSDLKQALQEAYCHQGCHAYQLSASWTRSPGQSAHQAAGATNLEHLFNLGLACPDPLGRRKNAWLPTRTPLPCPLKNRGKAQLWAQSTLLPQQGAMRGNADVMLVLQTLSAPDSGPRMPLLPQQQAQKVRAPGPTCPRSLSSEVQGNALIKLALQTLSTFDFGHVQLLEFTRDHIL
eukprot:scaffold103316_cov36-Tisochrysis_lutea.AAC.1